jgi:hypothetical protein
MNRQETKKNKRGSLGINNKWRRGYKKKNKKVSLKSKRKKALVWGCGRVNEVREEGVGRVKPPTDRHTYRQSEIPVLRANSVLDEYGSTILSTIKTKIIKLL